jgi:two-component system, NtrC family, sensor kinase
MDSRLSAPLPAAHIVAPHAVAAATPTATGFYLTLYAKGIIAFVALVAYLTIVGLYVAHERGRLQYIFQQLENIDGKNELLTKVNTALTHSVVALQIILNSGAIAWRWDEIVLDISAFSPSLPSLNASFPETTSIVRRFNLHLAELSKGRSNEGLIALRDSEQEMAAQLEDIETSVQNKGKLLSEEYNALNQRITVLVLVTTLFGLTVFGAVVMLFFSKLASDMKKLEARAVAVVGGYRGKPLDVTRHDEVGSLMEVVNRMQLDLRHWEQQQEISRQQHFHQEKMAAIGSLAAAVAHEINNPINSISGIAQHTMDTIRSHKRPSDETLCDAAELTLKQTERIASIVRQIADLSAPRSEDPELLNINELVENTCSFIRYDKRFRRIDLVTDPDHDLPAVRAVADHLTQVLMNLLINAADALEGMAGRNRPTIRVSTRQTDGAITLSVSDNGQGMDSEVLAHVFDRAFTTKPAGKGRGIGLYLCKLLIEEIDGRIELGSTQGGGTTAQVHLPSQTAHAAAG